MEERRRELEKELEAQSQSAARRTDRTGNLRNISDYNGGWGMLIQLDHVKKEYGDFTLELDMQIPENRVTGLIGANGAGKSTTFKLMLGLIQAGRRRRESV